MRVTHQFAVLVARVEGYELRIERASRTFLDLFDLLRSQDEGPLLDTIGVSSVERLGGIPNADADRNWDLVIATPAKLVDLAPNLAGRNRVCSAEGPSQAP